MVARKASSLVLLAVFAGMGMAAVLACVGCGGVAGLNWSAPQTEVVIPIGPFTSAKFKSKKDDRYRAKGVDIRTKDGTQVKIDEIELEGGASTVKKADVEQQAANVAQIQAQGNAFAQNLALGIQLGSNLVAAAFSRGTGAGVSYNPQTGLAATGPTGYYTAPMTAAQPQFVTPGIPQIPSQQAPSQTPSTAAPAATPAPAPQITPTASAPATPAATATAPAAGGATDYGDLINQLIAKIRDKTRPIEERRAVASYLLELIPAEYRARAQNLIDAELGPEEAGPPAPTTTQAAP